MEIMYIPLITCPTPIMAHLQCPTMPLIQHIMQQHILHFPHTMLILHQQNVLSKLHAPEAVEMVLNFYYLTLMDMDVMEPVYRSILVMKNLAQLIVTGEHGAHGPNVQ